MTFDVTPELREVREHEGGPILDIVQTGICDFIIKGRTDEATLTFERDKYRRGPRGSQYRLAKIIVEFKQPVPQPPNKKAKRAAALRRRPSVR